MLTARSENHTIQDVPGVPLRTNARPGTAVEGQLREIQSELSGGQVDLPSPTTVPHLSYFAVATVDGPPHSYISLWVPEHQAPRAAELLGDAGFTVT